VPCRAVQCVLVYHLPRVVPVIMLIMRTRTPSVPRKDSLTEGSRDLGPSTLDFSPLVWPAIEMSEEMAKDQDIGSRSTSSTASTCSSSSSSSSSTASSPSSSFLGKIATSQSTSQLLGCVLPVNKSPHLIGPVRTQRVSLAGQQGRLTAALYDMAVAKRKEVCQMFPSLSLRRPSLNILGHLYSFSFLFLPSHRMTAANSLLCPLRTIPLPLRHSDHALTK
jgi:hypothetical protein